MAKNNKYRSRDYHGYWETIKSLPDFRTKVEYTWENWNVQILAVAFVIVLVSSVIISNVMNYENVYLNGDFINVLLVQEAEGYEEDYLQRAFIQDYLQADPKEELIIKYTADLILDLNSDSSANAMIGGGCILSAGAIIDHDARLGDYCHINAGAIVPSMAVVPENTKVDYGQIFRAAEK